MARNKKTRFIAHQPPVSVFKPAGAHVLLVSDNPKFAPTVLAPEDVDAGALIGTVIWEWLDLR